MIKNRFNTLDTRSITNKILNRSSGIRYIDTLIRSYNVFAIVIPMNHSYIDDIYISERLECELYEHDRLCFKYKLNPDKVFRGFYCFNMNDSRYLFYDYEFYHDENLHDFISCFSKTFDIYYHELFNI